MDTIGLDLHKRESQLRIGRDNGAIEERRIVTSRERLTAVLGGRSRARVLEGRVQKVNGWRGASRALATR